MKKIHIKKTYKSDEPDGAHLFPLFDYLHSEGVVPVNGNYPENKDIFIDARDGMNCLMKGQADYDEIFNRFEFGEFISVNAESGTIVDEFNGMFIFLSPLSKDFK